MTSSSAHLLNANRIQRVCVCVSLVAGCLRLNRSPPPLAVKSHYNWDWGHLHMSTVHNCSNIWYKVQCRGFRPGMFNLLEKQSTVRVYHLGSELITDCTCDTHRKWGVLCCQSLQVYWGDGAVLLASLVRGSQSRQRWRAAVALAGQREMESFGA